MLTCSSLRESYLHNKPGTGGACTCDECVNACKRKTGVFLPDEIAPLARKMGLTVQGLFNEHLGVTSYETADGGVLVLEPKTRKSMDHQAPCVFLQDDRCTIHSIGKPFECAAMRCDVKRPREFSSDVVRVWSATGHQNMVWALITNKYTEPS